MLIFILCMGVGGLRPSTWFPGITLPTFVSFLLVGFVVRNDLTSPMSTT